MQNWDYKLFSFINGFANHNHVLDTIMVGIAKWGAGIYGLILLWLFFSGKDSRARLRNRKTVVQAVLAAIAALAINQLVGFVYFRPRPFASHHVNLLLDRSPDPSFPSDHATGASSLSFAVFGTKPVIGTVMFVLTIILIISRVYAGTHYPLDVIGGMLTGLIGSLIAGKLWPLIDQWVTKLLDLWESSMLKVFTSSKG